MLGGRRGRWVWRCGGEGRNGGRKGWNEGGADGEKTLQGNIESCLGEECLTWERER